MLEEKVKAVEQIFDLLDLQIAELQKRTGLHCKFGCGACCFKPDIEATILEFLPFAFHVYQQQKAIDVLNSLKKNSSPICLILNSTQTGKGLCSQYTHRGLICRLFGYSARTDKYGKRELVTCTIIKTEQEHLYKKASQDITSGEPVPVMNQFYMQLYGVDMELARTFYPINTAIRLAVETVLQYYTYRETSED